MVTTHKGSNNVAGIIFLKFEYKVTLTYWQFFRLL